MISNIVMRKNKEIRKTKEMIHYDNARDFKNCNIFWPHFGPWTKYSATLHLDLLMVTSTYSDRYTRRNLESPMIPFWKIWFFFWRWSLNKNSNIKKKVYFSYVSALAPSSNMNIHTNCLWLMKHLYLSLYLSPWKTK